MSRHVLTLGALLFGCAVATAAADGAPTETWHVFSATRHAAVLVDSESRITTPTVTINVRDVHAGIEVVQGRPIVASQFTFEFDCKQNRMRTVLFSLVDVGGHIPDGLTSNKVRDWEAVDETANSNLIESFACDGKLPLKLIGPYKDFTDIEAKYLMWLEYPDDGDFTGKAVL